MNYNYLTKTVRSKISFYCSNLDFLPPKPKLTFRNLKKAVQQSHRKFVLAQISLLTTLLFPLSQNLALLIPMSIICLMRGMSLIGINAIWLLSLACLLMRIMARFLHYTDNLNFKSCFIANSSSCTTIEMSFILTSCLTAIKNHVKQY